METNSTLTYTGEIKQFRFEDGGYVLIGDKEIKGEVMTTVRNGQVLAEGRTPCGNFFIRFTGEEARITLSDVPDSIYTEVYTLVHNLIEALKD